MPRNVRSVSGAQIRAEGRALTISRAISPAVQSTCPWTKCPPMRPSAAKARSRFTAEPCAEFAEVCPLQRLIEQIKMQMVTVAMNNCQTAAIDRHAVSDFTCEAIPGAASDN